MDGKQQAGQAVADVVPANKNALSQGGAGVSTVKTPDAVNQNTGAQPDPNKKAEESPAYQKRIDELTHRSKSAEEAVKALEIELAELRGRVSQSQESANSNDPWTKLSNAELLQIATSSDYEQSVRSEAIKRYDARQSGVVESLQAERQKAAQAQENFNKVWSMVKSDFGADVDNPASPIRQEAQNVYNSFKEKLGPGIDGNPTYQYLAFQAASQKLNSSSDSKVAELERELAKYKQNQTLESAGGLASDTIADRNRAKFTGTLQEQMKSVTRQLLGIQ